MKYLRLLLKQRIIRQLLIIAGAMLIIALTLVLFIEVVIPAILSVNWPGWTGFNSYTKPNNIDEREKTLWDWLNLLIVPIVLAIGGFILNRTEKQREQQRAAETQREAALQAYFDHMTSLLIEKELRESEPGEEIRAVARARTITVLQQLDPNRKRILVQFLYEANLVKVDRPVLFLQGADLTEVNLQRTLLLGIDLRNARMERANLKDAILHDAYLLGVKLKGADLSGAALGMVNFQGADLQEADLNGALLEKADLQNAIITTKQLASCKTLKGATLPDGTKVPDDIDNPFR